MSAARQQFGELGEQIAERWLRRHGWRVMQRRFRSGHRDIDLVVEREGTVAFVEVKARRGSRFGDPVEAVNWSKQRELIRSASVCATRIVPGPSWYPSPQAARKGRSLAKLTTVVCHPLGAVDTTLGISSG